MGSRQGLNSWRPSHLVPVSPVSPVSLPPLVMWRLHQLVWQQYSHSKPPDLAADLVDLAADLAADLVVDLAAALAVDLAAAPAPVPQ